MGPDFFTRKWVPSHLSAIAGGYVFTSRYGSDWLTIDAPDIGAAASAWMAAVFKLMDFGLDEDRA